MTVASEVLSEVEALGVAVRPHGSLLEVRPKSRLTDDLMQKLRAHKPGVMALVKVREALADGLRLSALQIQVATGLEYRELYAALGEFYDWYEVSTDLEGRYWLVDPPVN